MKLLCLIGFAGVIFRSGLGFYRTTQGVLKKHINRTYYMRGKHVTGAIPE